MRFYRESDQPIPTGEIAAWCLQGFLSVHDPLTVLEQEEELMNTGEFAGIPSQVSCCLIQFKMCHAIFDHLSICWPQALP